MQVPVQCPAMPFINRLENKLRGTSGLDTVLAALIAHAQQNAATGSKLAPGALAPASSKQEVLEVTTLSAVQEHHSSARALPLLIRLYFNTGSRTEVRPRPSIMSSSSPTFYPSSLQLALHLLTDAVVGVGLSASLCVGALCYADYRCWAA